MIPLRDYQAPLMEKTAAGFRLRRRMCIVAPTGSGKTYIVAAFSDRCARKGNVCWVIVPKPDLVEQTVATFFKLGIDFGVVCAGHPARPFAKVQVCSIDTLRNRHHKLPPPDLILVDEAHHILARTWSALIAAYPNAFIAGFTASPVRGDGQGLGAWFDELVIGPSIRWLMDRGFLSRYKLYAPSAPDMSGVHSARGDWVAAEADAAMKRSVVVGDIIGHHQKLARGLRTILFAPSIKTSKEYAEAFMAAGIVAVHLDGDTCRADRMVAFKGLAAGHIDMICNVNLIGEGIDLAALAGEEVTLECMIDASPTQSLGLIMQRWGRVLRPKPHPAIILDHAGNAVRADGTMNHGLPDMDREWSLEGRKKAKRKKDEEAAVVTKQCPSCFYVHHPAPACPNCGEVYQTRGRQVDRVDGDLEELNLERLREAEAARKRQQGQELKAARTLDDLIALGIRWGRKDPVRWAARIQSERDQWRRERDMEHERRFG